jgi:predicted PurR-regulated permease PerM
MQQNAPTQLSEFEEAPAPKTRNSMIFEIRAYTVVKATLTVLLVLIMAWVLFTIRDKLLILFLSLFIAIVMDQHVRRLERLGVPRGMSVFLLYLIVFAIVVLFLGLLTQVVRAASRP